MRFSVGMSSMLMFLIDSQPRAIEGDAEDDKAIATVALDFIEAG